MKVNADEAGSVEDGKQFTGIGIRLRQREVLGGTVDGFKG